MEGAGESPSPICSRAFLITTPVLAGSPTEERTRHVESKEAPIKPDEGRPDVGESMATLSTLQVSTPIRPARRDEAWWAKRRRAPARRAASSGPRPDAYLVASQNGDELTIEEAVGDEADALKTPRARRGRLGGRQGPRSTATSTLARPTCAQEA